MFQTLKNAWRVPELKSKILFTLLIIVVYRLGSVIPVPFVDSAMISAQGNALSGTIFDYMSFLSGQAFVTGTLFALSVSPYITSSIVMQLLTIAIPALERMAKEGEEGKKKIAAITRVVTVALALITAFGYTQLLKSGFGTGSKFLTNDGIFAQIIIIACYCAGASLIMWLAERINEHGIGNGISMILFANIISGIPALLGSVWAMMFDTMGKFKPLGLVLAIVSIAITLAIVVMVVWFTESERRIPIQYAKRQVGRKMYGGQASHLPLKMNMAGVMPIIFASSIVSIPATIAGFVPNSGFATWVDKWLGVNSWIYLVIYIVLILLFSYFYIMISFNPIEVSNNIRSQGGAVPGIRPGKPTADYIARILRKITTIGAVFLIFVAAFPMVVNNISMIIAEKTSNAIVFTGLAFGGTSLLIVVGVALETFRALEAQLSMRNYKGFLD
jgi:preprotein translocase subunit SecY